MREASPARILILISLLMTLAACGGGDSGGGDNPSSRGGFTLSTSSVAFSAKRLRQLPPVQVVRLHLTDNAAATVGAAYVAPQTDPGWLGVSITGTAPDFDVALSITTTGLPLGQHSAVLTLGTADAGGTVLQSRTVQITLTVVEPISLSATSLTNGYILGHSTTSISSNLSVTAGTITQWQPTASHPWIVVPSSTSTGSGPLTVAIDSSALGLGQHTGTVTVTSTTDPSDTATLLVTANVSAPSFSVSPATLTLGGADGLDMTSGQSLQIDLGTGTNEHPWTATLVTDSGGAWLNVSAASGLVNDAATSITVNADRSLVAPGQYTGAVRIDATVRGEPFSRTVPVTFNKEGHWIQVSSLGAAFSSFPGRSVLTRTLEVRSSQGRTDVPWTAQSDQSWLTVTPSGLTGGTLTLTADPSGLASDQQYLANVYVASSDASVLNGENVRVGLWVGSADPQDVTINADIPNVAANPVEPYVYTNTAGSDITVYDVYSGAVVRTFASAVARAGHMAVSSDGAILFVNDDTNLRVVALDAATGAELRRYPWGSSSSGGIAYARPNAQPVLIIGAGSAFDVETGELYTQRIDAGWYYGTLSFAVDSFSRYVYTQNLGLSPSTLSQYAIAYTMLGADRFVVRAGPSNSGGSNGQDICVSGDGARVYTANGAPYVFPAFGTSTLQQVQELPGDNYPNNAVCGWNGLFFGGAAAYYDPVNVWVYRPDGTQVATLNMHPAYISNLLRDTLVLSGDNTRLMASTEANSSTAASFDIRSAPSP